MTSEDIYKELIRKVIATAVTIIILCLCIVFNYLITHQKKESDRLMKEKLIKEIMNPSVEH